MRIEWSRASLAHLASIYEYIARDSALYAQQTIERLVNRVAQLRQFPQSGRVVTEYQIRGIRELIVNPYRVIDQLSESHIEIVAIVHSRQRFQLGE